MHPFEIGRRFSSPTQVHDLFKRLEIKYNYKEDLNMMKEKLYTCYETEQTMRKKDWFLFYLTSDEIDKTEYKDFIEWWHDMRKSGVIEEA